MSDPEASPAPPATPLHLLLEGDGAALAAISPPLAAFAAIQGFKGQAGQVLLWPDPQGALAAAVCGLGKAGSPSPAALRGLSTRLPPGAYALETTPPGLDLAQAALAWAQGAHVYDRLKSEAAKPRAVLQTPAGVDAAAVERIAAACALARDMVTAPASHMGPADIEETARRIAADHGAEIAVTQGEALLTGYPAVHAVGRAAAPDRAPRIIELSWTGPGAGGDAPRLVLVGKGVSFDTGGLDLKPSSGMRLMKKDMGGAAHALALAQLVMGAGLPVALSVLVPAVENAVSADAVRPGDVLATRRGLSVEVGNTDAEGRLILADALTRAEELAPDLTVDLATLTGAARVALGPEVIPFYTADDALAEALAEAAVAVADPLWRMPLWPGYEDSLSSDVADLKNDPDAWAQAGSVTAALFLQRFAPKTGAWVHLDIYAWNPRARPGWPVGGEAQAIRALFHLLQQRYGSAPDGPAA